MTIEEKRIEGKGFSVHIENDEIVVENISGAMIDTITFEAKEFIFKQGEAFIAIADIPTMLKHYKYLVFEDSNTHEKVRYVRVD